MIKYLKNIKDKPLVVVFLLYVISSYICQETLLPPRINSLFLMAYVGLSFIYFFYRKEKINLHFSKWYIILVLYALCSALLMTNTVFSTLYQMFVVLVLTFCFSITITSEKTLELTLVTYMLSAVAMGMLIMYYNPIYLLGNVDNLNGERLGGEETGNANIFTALMMFSGVLASWLALYKRNIIIRVISALSLLLVLYLMALSGGRKTIIALVACLLFFIWKKSGNSIKKRIIALTMICLTMYFLLYLMMNVQWIYDVVGYRFDGILGFIGGTGESNVSSDDLRKKMILIGLQGWTERPIFGHGLDSFKFFNATVTGRMFYSHNNYVEMLYDFGLVGFVFYYAFIYRLYKRLISMPKEYSIYSILGIGIIIELLFFDIGGVAYYISGNMNMLCIATIISYAPIYFRK